MGERGRRQPLPPAAPAVADVDGGDGVQLAVAEQRAARRAGRARGEHQRDRALGVVVQRTRYAAGNSQQAQQVVDSVGRRHVALGQHQLGVGHPQHAVALDRREPCVHACGDGAHLGGGEVSDHVLGDRRQGERHHVALADALAGQPDGDLVRDPVEVGIGERVSSRSDGPLRRDMTRAS